MEHWREADDGTRPSTLAGVSPGWSSIACPPSTSGSCKRFLPFSRHHRALADEGAGSQTKIPTSKQYWECTRYVLATHFTVELPQVRPRTASSDAID